MHLLHLKSELQQGSNRKEITVFSLLFFPLALSIEDNWLLNEKEKKILTGLFGFDSLLSLTSFDATSLVLLLWIS